VSDRDHSAHTPRTFPELPLSSESTGERNPAFRRVRFIHVHFIFVKDFVVVVGFSSNDHFFSSFFGPADTALCC